MFWECWSLFVLVGSAFTKLIENLELNMWVNSRHFFHREKVTKKLSTYDENVTQASVKYLLRGKTSLQNVRLARFSVQTVAPFHRKYFTPSWHFHTVELLLGTLALIRKEKKRNIELYRKSLRPQ